MILGRTISGQNLRRKICLKLPSRERASDVCPGSSVQRNPYRNSSANHLDMMHESCGETSGLIELYMAQTCTTGFLIGWSMTQNMHVEDYPCKLSCKNVYQDNKTRAPSQIPEQKPVNRARHPYIPCT